MSNCKHFAKPRRGALAIRGEYATQRVRSCATAVAALVVLAGVAIPTAPARAQGKSEEAPATSAVCMARQVRGGKDDGRSLAISVSADKADEFQKRGFAPIDCSTSRVAEASAKQDFCDIAQARNRGVDLYFQQHFGFTPKEGCKTFSAVSVR